MRRRYCRTTPPAVVVAWKGYDKKELVAEVEACGAEGVMPTRQNLREQREVDPHVYLERNVVERFRARIKKFRRVLNLVGRLHGS